jgi:hypothetical protein
VLVEFGAPKNMAVEKVLAVIRADQEEAIEFKHTLIEHGRAVQGEWNL